MSLASSKQAYLDNADYAEVDSTAKARAFATACRQLLVLMPRSSRRGGEGVDLDPSLIERQLNEATAWLSGRDDFAGTGATTRADLGEYRS